MLKGDSEWAMNRAKGQIIMTAKAYKEDTDWLASQISTVFLDFVGIDAFFIQIKSKSIERTGDSSDLLCTGGCLDLVRGSLTCNTEEAGSAHLQWPHLHWLIASCNSS